MSIEEQRFFAHRVTTWKINDDCLNLRVDDGDLVAGSLIADEMHLYSNNWSQLDVYA